MTLAIVNTRAQLGIQSPPVAVEVHLSGGLPCFIIVGMPETGVKESRERVRSSLLNSGFEFPARRITVNLAPADLPKEGGRYDLAIAIGILIASKQLPQHCADEFEFLAELALSGRLRPVSGVLPVARSCREAGRSLWLASESLSEAELVNGLTLFGANSLLAVSNHLSGAQLIETAVSNRSVEIADGGSDMADVRGQYQAKRALEIAAGGGHNLLLCGPPGSGKSMLASRLPGILPPLESDELLDIAAIYSVAGVKEPKLFAGIRPFRNPHHTASAVALVGGGSNPRPGEISLAHQGVLFLDELPEYSRQVLEVMREPLESGEIHISRAALQTSFPASFQLIAAMNPCPCGYRGDQSGRCRCTPDQVQRYQGKISGPLLDRIDLQSWVPGLTPEQLMGPLESSESSGQIRARVIKARARQMQRQGCINDRLGVKGLEQYCCLGTEQEKLLMQAMSRMGLSARATHRVLKVSRTIADLHDESEISSAALLEAIGLRRSPL
ncbi:YifB family Mg chelatase-like AAA ATPase [Amphritea japonica]|uniref:Magnesium chelatase family protein n=1 Tax=Amphritea japonica ATCC BAA-1530 TaxID=1278309 RepID=A0A7R6SRT0_9GAMM|nr:YifB family Mg chelatase-like AAA ATPase [Amphritea japonica]BBB24767.1 magnesium chelatase family protein [Amphritea japonica ATCC BAA-1530]